MRLSSLMLVVLASLVLVGEPAFAEDAATVHAGYLNLGQLALGIAVFGGAMGQGRVISAAVESISRNPGAAGQMFLPWILGVSLIESLVLFMFLVAIGVV